MCVCVCVCVRVRVRESLTLILAFVFDVAVGVWCLNVRLHAMSTIVCLTAPMLAGLVVVEVLMESKVSLCGAVDFFQLGYGETKRLQCQPVIIGHSVKLKKFHGHLTLCEVEVYGVYGKTTLLYFLYNMFLIDSDSFGSTITVFMAIPCE